MRFLERVKNRIQQPLNYFRYKHNRGYCNICEQNTVFFEFDKWLRDYYKCQTCGSIPRNRALVDTISTFYPDWKNLDIHESSPGGPVSEFLKKKARRYTNSHYYEDIPRGLYQGEYRSEDLTRLTFPDNSFDLFITSDVFEHVFNPAEAFAEIARVLKPGGAHIFTMPWYPSLTKSVARAKIINGKIEYLQEAIYHGNPIDNNGSLVTNDWGQDFCDFIYKTSGLFTIIFLKKDRNLGLEAEFPEVFISKKPSVLEDEV